MSAGRLHNPGARAMRFVVLLGVVSLCADATYEGARSITGPFLAVLGATGAVVGLVAGFGELVGYGLRLASGYLSDRTGSYWTITLVGYGLNLVAVPLLALAGRWEVAAALIILERVGKAIRTPARDAMLSHATGAIGRGRAFGLHEALDQAGAVAGPLIAAAAVAWRADYRPAFAVLLMPAVAAYAVLLAARRLYPQPRDLDTLPALPAASGFDRTFWIYMAAVALVAAGYVDFPLMAFHFARRAVLPAVWIPVLYAVAMGVDALGALVFGPLFDRAGLRVVVWAVLGSSLFAPLAFLGGTAGAVLGAAVWGLGMGAQESVMRAAVAGMVPADRRGLAYGVFNTGYGVFWFLGSAVLGRLYDVSLAGLVAFSIVTQLAAIPLLLAAGSRGRARSA